MIKFGKKLNNNIIIFLHITERHYTFKFLLDDALIECNIITSKGMILKFSLPNCTYISTVFQLRYNMMVLLVFPWKSLLCV